MLHYLIAFNDLHNFHIPADVYRKFLREEYFATRLPLEPFDVNNPFYSKQPLQFMTREKQLKARESINAWANKNYPETFVENVKILDEYLTLCEENNIRPIMFLVPMPEGYIKHFNRRIIDGLYYAVKQACRKHSSAIFLDGWKLQGFTDRDFYDYGHMNIAGAAKFSVFLNEFICGVEAQGL